ncbi:MAG: PD40 domain-containing protein [Candidatus Eisenbacteria bacterium]|nr:PD40 domain-containing protein [Candidatus Eisenbacteria bacterium]
MDGTNAALFGQIDFGRFPSWSPAGDKIAFVSERQVGMESVFRTLTTSGCERTPAQLHS